jgi:enamine deaminase RidA (YjgF/YER057c/UK114 family)
MEQRSVNPWTWQDNFGFSQAVEFKDHERVLVCAGQTSVDENGSPVNAGDMTAQVNRALDNLETVLQKAGMSLANVVRLNIYTTDVEGIFPALPAWAGRLKAAGCQPASTLLGVQRLAFPELMVELEATAVA